MKGRTRKTAAFNLQYLMANVYSWNRDSTLVKSQNTVSIVYLVFTSNGVLFAKNVLKCFKKALLDMFSSFDPSLS